MRRLPVVLFALVIAAAATACGGPSASPSTAPTAAAPSSVQPSAAPTPSPSASAAAVLGKAPAAVTSISLYEWKAIVASTMKAGKTSFTISNFGTMPHELLVFKSNLAPSAYPVDTAGNIKEEGPGVTLLSDGENIDPTGAQIRTIDLTPGKYVFVCNIPGHFKHGMFTVVTVGA